MFHMSISGIPCNTIVTNNFCLVTLTFELSLLFENHNFANNFSTLSVRVFIFHINIPCDKVFLLVLNFLTLTFNLLKKINIIQKKI